MSNSLATSCSTQSQTPTDNRLDPFLVGVTSWVNGCFGIQLHVGYLRMNPVFDEGQVFGLPHVGHPTEAELFWHVGDALMALVAFGAGFASEALPKKSDTRFFSIIGVIG